MSDREESVTDDPGTPVSRSEYDWGAVDPSTAVVEAVAAVAGCDPMALDPLTRCVDPDALDRFVRTADEGASMQFRYAAYRVTVRSNGEVAVQRADADADD